MDTSIWSLALRRSNKRSSEEGVLVNNLIELIDNSKVTMIGPIRQEVLSGISSLNLFEDLKDRLHAFYDLPLSRDDYERAAEFFNICRSSGVQGSHIDFLICAVANNRGMEIFTADKDFFHYAKYLKIDLYTPL